MQRNAIIAIVGLKDPAAAKRLVELYPKLGGYHKLRIQRAFEEGYPGVNYDKKTKKATLVPQEELDKLLKARDAEIEKLEKLLNPKQ